MTVRRPRSIPASETMSAAAAPLSHRDPINLAVGEPAEPLPPFLVEAGAAAYRDGATRYGSPAGMQELRTALAEEQAARDGIARAADEVIVTAGAKPALLDALRILAQPDDEVIVLAPYWPTFVDQIRLIGARPVVTAAGPDGLPRATAIEDAVSPATKVLILNSPNNPSGRVYGRELLRAIAEIVARHDLWVLSDHAYVDLAFGEPPPILLSVAPELRDQAIIVESFSKRFSMTGLRLGAAIGPEDAIRSLVNLASTMTTHPNSVAQHVGLAAITLGQDWLDRQRETHRRRHDIAFEALSGIPGLSINRSEAGMFLFPNVADLMHECGIGRDQDLARLLAEQAGVRVVPGVAFGATGHLRFSYGVDDARLVEAMDRTVRCLTECTSRAGDVAG